MPRPRLSSILLAMLVALLPCQFAGARRKPVRKLIEQVPQLDTSILPVRSRFELEIKHTEMIQPQNHSVMLHAKARVVRLQGDETTTVLRGQVAHEDQTAPLRGRVAQDNPASPLQTFEHGVRPRFYLDLKKLTATIAPDLEHQMEAEIGAARRKVAGELELEQKRLDRELQAQRPRPDAPLMPPKLSASAGLTNAAEAEAARCRQIVQEQSGGESQKLAAAMEHARGQGVLIPGIAGGVAGGPVPVVPRTTGTGSPSPSQKIAVRNAEREMETQLAAANHHQSAATTDLNAELESARHQSQTTVRNAQPAMDAILTYLRKIPPADAQMAKAEARVPQDSSEVIAWDAWHAKFARLARLPLLNSISKAGNPSGQNTVEITVTPDHRVSAKVTTPGNAAFDRAVLNAYRSLNGNPELAYPSGSRRTSIAFLIDNEHKSAGTPTGVNSQTSIGDQEILHFHR